MSIVAVSETAGSLGTEIARRLAGALGYEFADREIIVKAAERYGERLGQLRHATEEKPTLLEHFSESRRRYMTYVEAVLLEMAARNNVVLVGRGGTIVLADVPHALRLRVSAPERVRAERLEQQEGLTREAALDYVRDSDRERGARLRFLYHVDWDDPLLYDLVLSTERLSVDEGVRIVREALLGPRYQPSAEWRDAMVDRSLAAQARATLLAHPATRSQPVAVTCVGRTLSLRGSVRDDAEREAVQALVGAIPGVAAVRDDLTVEELSHGQFRHGEERSWGGYGGGWYDRSMASGGVVRRREEPPGPGRGPRQAA